jgi:hypothetical protein
MRGIALAAIATVLAVVMTEPVIAGGKYFKSGADLVRDCSSSDAFLQGACRGYVLGQMDALEAQRWKDKEPSCLKPHAQVEQTANWIIRSIKADSVLNSDIPASVAIWTIYSKACPE